MTTNPFENMIARVVNDGEATRARASRSLRAYLGLDPNFRPVNAENLMGIVEQCMLEGKFSDFIPSGEFKKAGEEIGELITALAATSQAFAEAIPGPHGREIPKEVWLAGGEGLAADILASDATLSLVLPHDPIFPRFYIRVDTGRAVAAEVGKRAKAK